MNFHIPLDGINKFNKWNKEHIKTCKYYQDSGTIGERLTYEFTPTGIGTIIKIKCACGEEIDLTDYENW